MGRVAIPVDIGARPGTFGHWGYWHTSILRLGDVLAEGAYSKPGSRYNLY